MLCSNVKSENKTIASMAKPSKRGEKAFYTTVIIGRRKIISPLSGN
jgi:hypothetical protein